MNDKKVSNSQLKKLSIDVEFLQLDRYLQAAGLASRRQAESLIKSGRVTIDGKKEVRPFRRVKLSVETVRLDGTYVRLQKKHVYLVLNKPIGYICTNKDPEGRPTIFTLIPDDRHVFSVGRLDVETSGIMIVTSDGEFARRLELPKYEIERKYEALVDEYIEDQQIRRAKRGVLMDGRKTRKIRIYRKGKVFGRNRLEITLIEGRYHEVRRLIDKFRLSLFSLKRFSFADITDNDIPLGKWRALTTDEIYKLKLKVGLIEDD